MELLSVGGCGILPTRRTNYSLVESIELSPRRKAQCAHFRGQDGVTIEGSSEDKFDRIVYHPRLDYRTCVLVNSHELISNLVGLTLAEVERSLILATLRYHSSNRTRAAAMLGISLRTMRNKLKLYREGLDEPEI